MKTASFISFFILCLFLQVKAQSTTAKEKLSQMFEQNRKGYTTYRLEQALLEDSVHYHEILWLIKPYYLDSKESIRNKAYQITSRIGLNASDDEVRAKVINSLVQCLEDKTSGLVGMIISYLFEFNPNDYNSVAKRNLQRLARTGISHYSDLIKLTGYVNISELIPFYKEKLEMSSSKMSSIDWAMHIALGRMGDEWEVEYCLNKVKRLGINNAIVLNLFPDLVFMDSQLTYDYLLNIILSDCKNCHSPQPDNEEKIICAFKVMELVAPYIDAFPVQLNFFGEIETDDYGALLDKVRAWIRTEWNK